jgi:hypothetical protein
LVALLVLGQACARAESTAGVQPRPAGQAPSPEPPPEPASPADSPRTGTAAPPAAADPTPTAAPTETVPASGITIPPPAHRSARLSDLQGTTGPAPVGLVIDGLGLDATVLPVGVDPSTGELDVPPDAGTVVWYEHGSSPGAPGSAVLAAHVDYDGRRGAFFRLRELEPGATVSVAYDDGSTRTFTVSTRRSYDKDALPTDELFTREGPAILTLVTCGGPFDAAARSYLENVVVQAVPVG